MTTAASRLPAARSDLVIRPLGDGRRHVVKDPARRDYFELGEEECFLLSQLDGAADAEAICGAFEAQFGEPLGEDDLDGFVTMAAQQGLLEHGQREVLSTDLPSEEVTAPIPRSTCGSQESRQSILYWRTSLLDPDRFFAWLEPKIQFFWTRAFVIASAGCILWAVIIVCSGRHQVASSFAQALRWETLLLAWLSMFVIGLLHECAHGLTCKHYGGEVREIGFLLMYFMPCYYCNVSDAWLFREKSKRLWVTFAGGYFELFLWALAVFVWRLTVPDSLINYLAFIVVAACGIETFFNFNPLIKLDGYYLLADWMEIPNLRQRSLGYTMSRLRQWLWGGPQPDSQPSGGFLFGFGMTSWIYSLSFLVLMLTAMCCWFRGWLGMAGLPLVGVLGFVSTRGLLGDLFQEEFLKMLRHRHVRSLLWGTLLVGLVGGSLLVPWTDHAGGDFEVRATRHSELRAPVAGFLEQVCFDEGDELSPGDIVGRLAVPDLDSRIACKQAELREAEAKLKLLQAGTRAEERIQQRRRVAAATSWRDVVARDLERQQLALEQELIRFDKMLAACRAECDYAQRSLARHESLRRSNAVSEDEYLSLQRAYLVSSARYDQTQAERESRAALGTLAAESVLAERQMELVREEATLQLLEAGSRVEEVEAAEATVARIREDLAYLIKVNGRLELNSPIAGTITSRRLRERVGAYLEEGELVCELEDACSVEVLIKLDEDRAAGVRPGQVVLLKARTLAFDTFEVQVERIAPRAEACDGQSKVHVYCSLEDPHGRLRSGMTGYARIHRGSAPMAIVLANHCLKYIRTEFWW